MSSLKKMINRNRFLLFALFLVIILVAITLTGRGHFYDIEVFKSGDGWGYDITKKNKTYIHQPFIPAIEGEIPFSDKRSARKTGRLVIKKIRSHKSPAVTSEEIKSIIDI
jgi:hypothetical protein